MTEFKVGDVVRVEGEIRTLLSNDDKEYPGQASIKRLWFTLRGNTGSFYEDELELITSKETTVMARRTFKLLKDTPTTKKGAIFQEECDDGTQPYECISGEEFDKGDDHRKIGLTDRSLVEDQPDWFVEVFMVEPEYMTAEELERYRAFIKLGSVKDITFRANSATLKPAKRKYTKRAVKRGPGRPRKVTQ